MHYLDQGIITQTKKYGENSQIIKILSKEHGLYSGMVKGISRRNVHIYQIGNFVEATYRARLSEQLGFFKVELIKTNTIELISNKLNLFCLSSINDLINYCLVERNPEPELYYQTKNFIETLTTKLNCLEPYVFYELNLLNYLGFGLDLSKCIKTNSKAELIYISPKSGCAVSKEAGAAYHDKLLYLPAFLVDKTITPSISEIYRALELTGFFLRKNIFLPQDKDLPISRNQLINLVSKHRLIASNQY